MNILRLCAREFAELMIPLRKTEALIKAYKNWFEENESELVSYFEGYMSDQKSDWIRQKHRKKIQSLLSETSYGKCAYCERKPDEGGGNMEVDHFYPKKTEAFKGRAFDFDNLLPACKQCNTAKGQRYENSEGNEIINPYNEINMAVHLSLDQKTMRLNGVSEKGKAAVCILGKSLNTNSLIQGGRIAKGAMYKRAEIRKCVTRKLELSRKHKQHTDVLFDHLKGLLELIGKRRACTATFATIILRHPVFKELVEFVKASAPSKYQELAKLIREAKPFCL
ncbi:HNH endonuclease [Desulfococcaceae bacterium HSG8]|nr:HNH endonuclease [Desulfococcaceae bacterium HSG8]